MPRFTTSAATDRRLLGLLLIIELIVAVTLVGTPGAAPSGPGTALSPTPSSATSRTARLSDGRTVELLNLGGTRTEPLVARVAAEMDDAAAAVTRFWGPDWRRDIVVVATANDDQFRTLAVGGADIAAATTAQRIVLAPGAAAMSPDSLRIVLRHELFHYAAREATAPDAPRWLTEGVADFVARPAAPRPGPQRAADLARLPTDADLDTEGPTRTLAYDRAWWFTRFVADRFGTATLRRLYDRACAPGHPDAATAVSGTLGEDLDAVMTDWRRWLT